jgi:hypothetical protein
VPLGQFNVAAGFMPDDGQGAGSASFKAERQLAVPTVLGTNPSSCNTRAFEYISN